MSLSDIIFKGGMDKLSVDSWFWTKDSETDYGIYRVGTYDGGTTRRNIYSGSENNQMDAVRICDALNSGKMTRDQFIERGERRLQESYARQERAMMQKEADLEEIAERARTRLEFDSE